MNYVEHHFGDYARDTAHLSLLEHGAYRLLLDLYYVREKALPAEVKDCCRLVRASSTIERKAVQTVLSEFFELTAEGWSHKRCDAEIARYRDKQEKAKRSASARWNGRAPQSDGNANADATAHANASTDAMRTHSEGNAHQTPDTRHQAPDTKGKRKTQTQGAHAPLPVFALPDWVPVDDWRAFDEHRRKAKKPMTERAKQLVVVELEKLRKAGHAPGPVLQQSVRRGWLDVFPLKADQLPLVQGTGTNWRNTPNTV
jgi:uncharacterized protein YdaU (DUF1376 family)